MFQCLVSLSTLNITRCENLQNCKRFVDSLKTDSMTRKYTNSFIKFTVGKKLKHIICRPRLIHIGKNTKDNGHPGHSHKLVY